MTLIVGPLAFNKNDGRCQAFNRDFTNQPVNGIPENEWTHYDVSPGNEALYQLTLSGGNELLILMQTWDGVWKYAHYTFFYIGPKNDNYRLHFSEYSGSAGNSLFYQVGYQFSTVDTDNDVSGISCNPKYHKGGFWFSACGSSDLNGYYYQSGIISTIHVIGGHLQNTESL
ncbi:unnamed protein product [Mytilus edulis]|uniref:Fibrinogen C-terminal domain-containing protein n=1 Tax=Mytilus edulis TaxID=6550 RepID=A0A8S3TX31_MYTED|nr:unnamed protein product [Mytilus edulis]